MDEIQESLEWHSVLNAVLDADIRTQLPSLDREGIIAYTDGACIKNPGGPAGWSALLWAASDFVNGNVSEEAPCSEYHGHIPKATTTTNNRAEIAAVLAVLSVAPPGLPLTIYSDSEYTIKVAQGTYKMKANPDLWEVYRKLISYRKQQPTFTWVQGHAGHLHNERADELAGLGAWNNDLKAFEKWQISQTPEARSSLSSVEVTALSHQAQRLQALFESIDIQSGRVAANERSFVAKMAKSLLKKNFVPTPAQSNWLKGLGKKYHV